MTITLPADATLRPLELPARADAGPSPAVQAYAAVRNELLVETTGRDDDCLTASELLSTLSSTPDRDRRHWAIELDGDTVGRCALDILQDDGGETAFITVALLRRAWSRGIGSAAYAEIERIARDAGVRKLLNWSEHHDADAPLPRIESPTGFGSAPADRSARFLQRKGFRLEQIVRGSALHWDDELAHHLTRLRDDAAAHAHGYRVIQWMIPTPDEHIDGYAWMKSRMSTDVPDGDLGMPEEVWDAERVRRQDSRIIQRGWSMLVTAALHITTGELAAFNELAIGDVPTAGSHQWDTLVLSEHRGHRLGMLVKTAGLLAWRERHPASPRVTTYNAEENRPMLSINEAIGFTPIAYEGAWRKDLA
ncbi:GNAT family N-acetyltransferase [Microbacterium esteraromaticum]|uniref:GNAT family N-acetyltransferase n=1 Tax=Microbacterium esteraromaticum TaxID=57043 RepID=A0A7D7WGM4_9MICO|nr:GNAT family N-acetyltransferase [Microbacterium esteraromaticum]QMU98052.1 GNAT family N-acetyltransferase [Microbacterium esteraromaticum]